MNNTDFVVDVLKRYHFVVVVLFSVPIILTSLWKTIHSCNDIPFVSIDIRQSIERTNFITIESLLCTNILFTHAASCAMCGVICA